MLNPKEKVLFTWSKPIGVRQLEWAPNVDADVCRLCKVGLPLGYAIQMGFAHYYNCYFNFSVLKETFGI